MNTRKFRVKVNGNTYDVEVEDLDRNASQIKAAHTLESAAAPKPKAVPAAPAAPAKTAGGPGWIVCPMAGKVQKISVKVGQDVLADTVVAVLEAMKMETSVCAGKKGTITEISASEGDVVDSGAPLLKVS